MTCAYGFLTWTSRSSKRRARCSAPGFRNSLTIQRDLVTYRPVGRRFLCSLNRAMCYTEQVSRARDQRYHEILERAARLIFQRGYEATSMQDIAESCGLTKAGLYHHIKTKEALLLAIMHYGMDLFEDKVLAKVADIADPVARLRETMARNITLVTLDSSKEVTIILHEHQTLTGTAAQEINS